MDQIISYLTQEDTLKLLMYLTTISFALLVVLGMTNTIIVYRDMNDFIWSIVVVVAPVFTFIGLSFLMPEAPPPEYDFYWQTTNTSVISLIGIIGTVVSMIKMFVNCIGNNGIVLGIVMFVFKILASIIVCILMIGIVGKIFDNKSSYRTLIVALIVFGVFTFILNRLVNGERVLAKRMI